MSALLAKQFTFARYLGQLLTFAAQVGIPVKLGECLRTLEQARWNAAHGTGISNSLHLDSLAVDLLCFRREMDGTYTWLKHGDEPEYFQLGTFWKSLHNDCCWGGDFTNSPDGGHFSITYGGRK